MKNRTCFLAAPAMALISLALAPQAHAAVYTYGFTGLTGSFPSGVTLAGQDDWVSVSAPPNLNATVRNDNYLNSGGNWAYANGTGTGTKSIARQNDVNFSYSIADGSVFTIEYDLRLGNISRGGRVGLVNSSDASIFSFGNSNTSGSQWTFIDKNGTVVQSADKMPTATDTQYHLVASIDLAANSGNGAFSLAVGQDNGTGGWATPVAVTGLQNINMHLGTTTGADLTGLLLTLFGGGGVDTITLTTAAVTVPAPAALPAGVGLLGLAGLFARRR